MKKTIPAKKLHAYIRAAIQVVFLYFFHLPLLLLFLQLKAFLHRLAVKHQLHGVRS